MSTENKKIKNATKYSYNGIDFKSLFEVSVYKLLEAKHIEPKYEEYTITLTERFKPTVPFYTRTSGRGFHLEKSNVQPLTYTPDFTFSYNGFFVIFEVKGYMNDVYPVKRKLFRKVIEEWKFPVIFFEIHKKSDVEDALDIIEKSRSDQVALRKSVLFLPKGMQDKANQLLDTNRYNDLEKFLEAIIARVEEAQRPGVKAHKTYSNIYIDELYKFKELLKIYKSDESS